jgi:hypothetical protein
MPHPPKNPEFDLRPWLIGRKRICAYCDMSWDTIKIMHKKHDMPVMRLPTGTLAALPEALDRWMLMVGSKLK